MCWRGDILENANAPRAFLKLVAADALATVAKAKLERWDLLDAVERARAAYLTLVTAADEIGVSSARCQRRGCDFLQPHPQVHLPASPAGGTDPREDLNQVKGQRSKGKG